MKAMLDFQWALTRVTAISGAAGAPELLNDGETDTSSQTYDASLRVTNWLETLEPGLPPPTPE